MTCGLDNTLAVPIIDVV